MSKGWDNATIRKLKSLMGKGLSTSEIGKKLGLSKNAVVGKLNRLGWNAKAGSVTSKTNTKSVKKATAVKKTTKIVTNKKSATVKKVTTKGVKVVTKRPAVTTKKKVAPKDVVSQKATKKPKCEKESKTARNSASKNLAMHQRIIQHSLEMANLKPNQCRWPIGDPDSENFHFCGKQVFTGKPYCYEHCRLAYQFTPPKKK